MVDDSLRRINIPVPNPALAEWLVGPECRKAIQQVVDEIFTLYVSELPERTGNLRKGAFAEVQLDGDRWHGYVGNRAVSYHPTRGVNYAGVWEYSGFHAYGRPTGRFIPAQHQLQRAAHEIAGQVGTVHGVNIPGISREERGRGSKLRSASSGQFVRNPINKDK